MKVLVHALELGSVALVITLAIFIMSVVIRYYS